MIQRKIFEKSFLSQVQFVLLFKRVGNEITNYPPDLEHGPTSTNNYHYLSHKLSEFDKINYQLSSRLRARPNLNQYLSLFIKYLNNLNKLDSVNYQLSCRLRAPPNLDPSNNTACIFLFYSKPFFPVS